MITIPTRVLAAVQRRVQEGLPVEVCGIIAGPAGQLALANRHIPLRNAAEDPASAFLLDMDEQLAAYADMDLRLEDPVVLYHSHPHGPAKPSPVDIRAAGGGTTRVWLIVSPSQTRAWRFAGSSPVEIGIRAA